MEVTPKNSRKAFKFSCISFSLILISIGILIANDQFELVLPVFIIGGGFTLAGLLGIVGWIYSLRSISEPMTYQKVTALVFSNFMVLLFVAFILGDLVGS